MLQKTTVLIIGNGQNRCDPERSFTFTRTIQCNRIYAGFKKDIVIRNLNTTLEQETGLLWEYVVTEFSELWIAYASPTLLTEEARRSVYEGRIKNQYEAARQRFNPQHKLYEPAIETTKFLLEKLQQYPPFSKPVTPTTGMIAIQEALRLGWEVHITGFDYFGGRLRIGNHFPLKEQAYQEELIAAGKLFVE